MLRLLQITALLFLAPTGAAAQEIGLYAEVADTAVAWLKEEGRSWGRVRAGSRWPVAVRDSLWVARGPVQLCVAGGRCQPKRKGKHRIEEVEQTGLLRNVTAQIGRLFGIMLPGPIRTTTPFAARVERGLPDASGRLGRHSPRELVYQHRDSIAVESLPPALLFPDGKGKVIPDDFQLVWLLAHSAQILDDADPKATRVRLYRTGAGCQNGTLVLDTLAATNHLDLSGYTGLLKGGATYRAELVSDGGTDTACFVAASSKEAAALQAKVEELAQALGMESPPADWADSDEALALVGLLLDEGYTYDALLALDAFRRRAPNDWYLLLLWGQLLEATQSPAFD